MQWLQQLPWASLGRWWIVGLAFHIVGLGALYVFKEVLNLPLMVLTLMAAECTLLVRFLVNDRWVFGHRCPTWSRLWQYHAASAGGAAIWWSVSNLLPRFGIHYLIAATIGTGCSVFFSMFTNFLWIWRQGKKAEASHAH
jgi:putative flippase GtrA